MSLVKGLSFDSSSPVSLSFHQQRTSRDLSTSVETTTLVAEPVIVTQGESQSSSFLPSQASSRSFHQIGVWPLGRDLTLLFLSYLDRGTHKTCRQIEQFNVALDTAVGIPVLWKDFDLDIIFPSITFFWPTHWLVFFDIPMPDINLSAIPPLNKNILIPFLAKIKGLKIVGNAGVSVLQMPARLTLNKLIKQTEQNASINWAGITRVKSMWQPIIEKIGDMLIDKPYVLVIANNILPKKQEDQDFPSTDQTTCLNRFSSEYPVVQKPSCIDIFALMVLTQTFLNIRLFNDSSHTCTCCEEVIDGKRVLVGDFSEEGVYLGPENDYFNIGEAVMWKFYA